MKKIIRLTESDLTRIVKRIINETSRTECRSGDCQDGKGRYRYDSGDVYYGYFKDGIRNGRGYYTWADGGVYDGEWIDGHRDKGTYTYKSGAKETGKWVNGKKEGNFKYTNKNGVTTNVTFRNDELVGTTYGELDSKTKESSTTTTTTSGIGLHPKDQAEGDAFREYLNKNVFYEEDPNSDNYGLPIGGKEKCSDGRAILKPSDNPGKVLPYKGPCIQEKWKEFGNSFRFATKRP